MENEAETINYRLSNIEKTLAELKDVVVENKLQAKDIVELKSNQQEILNAINSHDKRIRQLEIQPVKKDAEKWKTITDFIFKTVLTITAGIILAKIGLSI